jgi:hypothetical protein
MQTLPSYYPVATMILSIACILGVMRIEHLAEQRAVAVTQTGNALAELRYCYAKLGEIEL